MISLETKADTKPSSPLSLSTPDKEPTLSFSELLKGAGKKDAKVIQNGAVVLALDSEKDVKTGLKTPSKLKTPLSLLKGKDLKEGDVLLKGKGIKESLTLVKGKDLKESDISLKGKNVKESNVLLKGKSLKESDVHLKDSETHMKLSHEPLGLNPKITQNMTPKEIKVLIADAKQYLKSKILDSSEYKQSSVKELPHTVKGLTVVAKNYGINISKVSVEEVQVKSNPLASAKTISKVEAKDSLFVDEKSLTTLKKEVKTSPSLLSSDKQSVKAPKNAAEKEIQHQNIAENEKLNKHAEVIKQTPLHKAQDTKDHTTQQIVTARDFKIEEKTPKEKADETLKLLLRGEKPSVANNTLTSDFAVDSARVIAPSATSDASKSLEKLLHGDTPSESNNSTNPKVEGSQTLKTDSFEVKLNEAKQMIKYISEDVKTAIQDYKSPFTRVKIQLNPEKLGEVDLTIVQRGKNLHVNISSNNTAINALSMNANELKVQLTNNGINNATLNFNNSSQNGDQNSAQQQNRQNEKRADEEYNYFDNEEQNEEVLSSLEIVVPNYA